MLVYEIFEVAHWFNNSLIEADHKIGDKERFAKVAARYKETLDRMKRFNQYVADGGFDHSPELKANLQASIQKDLDKIKPYFSSYSKFRNTVEDEDTEFLFSEGLTMIRAWFQGWYMSRRTYNKVGPLLKAFRALQKICPNQDMTVFRVVAVDDANQAKSLKQMQTGPRSLQSWTTSMKSAKSFFNTQYADGSTMIVADDGHIDYVDKTKERDYVVIKAKISGKNILWSPSSLDALERYDMHATDSKLYPHSRINSNVMQTLHDYANQGEVVVYLDGMIPVLNVYPIHIRQKND